MSPEFILPIREDLVGIASYGAPQLDVPARLNVNENPFPIPDDLASAMGAAVADAAIGLNRYPDRDAGRLRQALADYLAVESGVRVPAAQVWAANGSNEVMHHLFLAFGGPGRLAITFDPTYSMYPEYARDTFTDFEAFPRRDDFRVDVAAAIDVIVTRKPSLVLVTSPNNPTGTAMPEGDIRAMATAALSAGAMVIVDEAYAEFRHEGVPSACALLADYPNLVVVRTMSKAFALAGARLGYAVAADRRVIDTLMVVRLPYHLSAVTQAVALTALQHADVLQSQVELLRSERDALSAWLTEQGFTVAPSDANFILFGMFPDRDAVWQGLLDRGVLIRQTGPQGWLRVTVGTPRGERYVQASTGRGHGPRRRGRPAMSRTARVERSTKESSVLVELELDGTGASTVDTGVPFFDHMLAQLAKHGGLDLVVRTRGDLEVDAHHTVEDTSLALGQAINEALGDRAGLRRYGDALVPLDECLVQSAVDLSGRPYLVHEEPELVELIGTYDTTLTRHIWESIVATSQITLHVRVISGRNAHHVVEAQFKSVARSLRDAVAVDPRVVGVPSTKGTLTPPSA